MTQQFGGISAERCWLMLERVSKFQQVLPDRLQTEMVGAYLLDFEGAARVLAEPASAEHRSSPTPRAPSSGLKCLSIRPAWAGMVVMLQAARWKDVENRTWTTRYRGPLVIHAPLGLTREEYEDACTWALEAGEITRSQLPIFEEVAQIRGKLIGAVRLVNVAPPGKSVSPWHHPSEPA